MPKQSSNTNGTVSPALGKYHSDLEELAAAREVKPNTLARQLLIFAIKEMQAGRIELPPNHAVRAEDLS